MIYTPNTLDTRNLLMMYTCAKNMKVVHVPVTVTTIYGYYDTDHPVG